MPNVINGMTTKVISRLCQKN